jgi:hypothetical protein
MKVISLNTVIKSSVIMIVLMVPVQAKAIQEWSILKTNLNDGSIIQKEIETIPIPTPIYDIAVSAYSEAFADDYKFPKENVVEMDEGVHYMQYRLYTEGKRARGELMIVLDKAIELDLPEGDYFRYENPKRRPIKAEEAVSKKAQDDGKIWFKKMKLTNYYDRNVYWATSDYQPEKKGGSNSSKLIKNIVTDYRKYRVIVVRLIPDRFSKELLEYGNPQLWIKKPSGKDYRYSARIKRDDFYKITIPELFNKKLIEVIDFKQEFHSNKIYKSKSNYKIMFSGKQK